MKWHTAMIDRQIPDFCNGLKNKNEPWYYFTVHYKNVCPFKAGHVEKFVNATIADLPPETPFSLVGKYRVTFYSYFTDSKGKTETDCMKFGFELAED
jgi:hypothetical protein